VVTSVQFNEWLQNPTTQSILQVLQEEESELAFALSQGNFISDEKERIYMGYVHALRTILDTEQLKQEIVEE